MSLHIDTRQPAAPVTGDLALIHGWGLCSAVFEPWLPHLAAQMPGLRIHLVDLPGYGGNRDVPVADLAATADAVMAALPPKVALAGWSLGGVVALSALARHAGQATQLVMLGATPSFLQRADWPYGVEPFLLNTFEKTLRISPTTLLGRFATLLNQGDAKAKELSRLTVGVVEQHPPVSDALLAGLHWLRDYDLRPLLPKIPHPTLWLHGAVDPLMPPVGAQTAAACMPHGQVVLLPGAAHAPFLAEPATAAEHLRAFLQGPAA